MQKMEKSGGAAADAIRRKSMKQFDIVAGDDNSVDDHHYSTSCSSSSTDPQTKTRIRQEWDILNWCLPDSIYVRVYKGRMDLLRAVIIGAAGTPYHDGLFFFDVQFPSGYPNVPPKVYHHSFGFRLSPRLDKDGSVCLSLLNSSSAKENEKWNPSESTVLQVLLSIQTLVSNAKPYFNNITNTIVPSNWWFREKDSLVYNERAFLSSCMTMLKVISAPPKHFEEVVVQHFRERAKTIAIAFGAYITVGGTTTATVLSKKYTDAVGILYSKLVKAFIKNGSPLENYVGDIVDDQYLPKNQVDRFHELECELQLEQITSLGWLRRGFLWLCCLFLFMLIIGN